MLDKHTPCFRIEEPAEIFEGATKHASETGCEGKILTRCNPTNGYRQYQRRGLGEVSQTT